MTSPLINRLLEQYQYPLLDADNYDLFVYGSECSVLFFAGDSLQFPESNDVAVILPELQKAFYGQLNVALIAKEIERELQQRFRFTRFPSLVFLKKGQYVGVISGILNWNEYLTQTGQLLEAPISKPPVFDIEKLCSLH